MTIAETREAKREMEKQIETIIREFEERTDLTVTHLAVNRYTLSSSGYPEEEDTHLLGVLSDINI